MIAVSPYTYVLMISSILYKLVNYCRRTYKMTKLIETRTKRAINLFDIQRTPRVIQEIILTQVVQGNNECNGRKVIGHYRRIKHALTKLTIHYAVKALYSVDRKLIKRDIFILKTDTRRFVRVVTQRKLRVISLRTICRREDHFCSRDSIN